MNSVVKILTVLLITVISVGSCKKSATNCIQGEKKTGVCTADYTPVCGCDNVTYSNACSASLNGISDYVQGECP